MFYTNIFLFTSCLLLVFYRYLFFRELDINFLKELSQELPCCFKRRFSYLYVDSGCMFTKIYHFFCKELSQVFPFLFNTIVFLARSFLFVRRGVLYYPPKDQGEFLQLLSGILLAWVLPLNLWNYLTIFWYTYPFMLLSPRGWTILSCLLWGPSLISFCLISSPRSFFDFNFALVIGLFWPLYFSPWRDHPLGNPLWGPNLISFYLISP